MSGFGLRRAAPTMKPPYGQRPPALGTVLRKALATSPLALSATMAIELVVAVGGAALAPPHLAETAVACALASTAAWCAALAARSERAFLAATVLLASGCALTALPVHRAGSAVVGAIGGAVVLAFAETGTTALERIGSRDHRARPSILRALWVAPIAVVGAAAGWLLLALEPDLSGFGLAAVAIGVLAAVCLVAFAAVLTVAAVARSDRE